MSATNTPALERLSFHEFDDEVCGRLHDIFSANNKRTVGLQADSTHLINHDKELYHIWNDHSQARIERLLLPLDGPYNDYIGEEILRLRNNPHLTHLGLSKGLDYPSKEELQQPNAGFRLQVLCDLLGTLPNLQAFWIRRGPHMATYDSISSEETATFEAAISNMSKACTTLRYVRIGKLAWRIYPDEACNVPRLMMLDEWDDQIECPSYFQTPEPLPWALGLNHIDL